MIEKKANASRGEQDGLETNGYSVRWTVENGLDLVFVVSRYAIYDNDSHRTH